MMKYKGYTAIVEFDAEAGVLHGELADIADVVTFQATSVTELNEEFRTSVDEYLEYCRVRGREPNRPFSGKLVLRMSPALHRDISTEARKRKISINNWIIQSCESTLRGAADTPLAWSVPQEVIHAVLAAVDTRATERGVSDARHHSGIHRQGESLRYLYGATPAPDISRDWTASAVGLFGKGVLHE